MSRKTEAARTEAIGLKEAYDALLDILGLNYGCTLQHIMGATRRKLIVRKRRKDESELDYLHAVGAGVAMGRIRKKK